MTNCKIRCGTELSPLCSVAKDMLTKWEIILMPHFNPSGMIEKNSSESASTNQSQPIPSTFSSSSACSIIATANNRKRHLAKKTVREMLTWSHYKFRQRLMQKQECGGGTENLGENAVVSIQRQLQKYSSILLVDLWQIATIMR